MKPPGAISAELGLLLHLWSSILIARPGPTLKQSMHPVINIFSFIYLKFIYFIYLFLAAFGLHCCMRAFSSCGKQGLLFVAVHGILIVVASLVAEHRLQASVVVAHGLQSAGSVVVVHGLNCSVACGIFRTRVQTHVPCIGRQILNHCATRETPSMFFKCPQVILMQSQQ